MQRPQYAPPVLPSFDTPLGDAEGQACGQSFKQTYIVRQPYKGVTTHEAPLPNLVPAQYDLRSEEIVDQIRAGIDDASAIMGGENPDIRFKFKDYVYQPENPTGQEPPPPDLGQLAGAPILTVTDPQNREAIRGALDRARLYLANAVNLKNYWATEYAADTKPNYADQHWPLYTGVYDAYPVCEGRSPGEVIDFAEEGTGFGTFNCPTEEAMLAHEADGALYSDFIRAAMHWARCAQEAVRVVALHHLNKAEYEKNASGGGFQLAQPELPPAIPSPPLAPPPPAPPEPGPGPGPDLPGAGDGPEPPPDEPTPAPVPAPTATVPAKTGFAALPAPVKAAAIGAGLYALYKLAAKR